MMLKVLPLLALALFLAPAANAQDAAPRPWYLNAEFLHLAAPAPPRGEVLRASTVEQLYDATARVRVGGTILLARSLRFAAPN